MTTPTETTEVPRTISSAADFKRNRGVELELPSGNVCLAKRADIMALLGEGVFPDSFTAIITETIAKAQKGPGPRDHLPPQDEQNQNVANEAMQKVLENPDQLRNLMKSFDRVVVMSVIQPKVALATDEQGNIIPDADRDENLVYTDDVDPEDKMFIFNWVVGGSADIDKFRQETSDLVAGVSNG